MDTKEIYEKTKSVSKINLWNMFMTALIFFLGIEFINFILDKILPTESYANSIEVYLQVPKSIFNDVSYVEFAFGKPLTYGLTKNIIIGVLTTMSFMALIMAILDFVKDYSSNGDSDFTITLFTDNLKAYKVEIFLTALVFTGISSLVSLVPYVGFIIEIILKIILFFVAFIIKENNIRNPFKLIVESFKRTRGYKFDLFKLMLKFIIPILLVLLLLVLASFLNFDYSSVITGIFLIILTLVSIRAYLLTNIAFALAYEDLRSYENFKNNFGRGEDSYLDEVDIRKNLEADNENY